MSEVPSLYDWAGGAPALERLTEVFYRKVAADSLLQPVFAHMDARHPQHVAKFIAEVFGGPAAYSIERGGHSHMIRQHLKRHLSEPMRRQWVNLLLDAADEAGLPADPEFRSAFLAYIEWGTRLALINSQPGVEVEAEQSMPKWGWGEAKGPYTG
ncbi:group II truncated hemoglobin [Rudaea cellulosilytica]|uniref:group II truncated hemoglobin n=1 Tax=Rudaea cellulosilytica TaxID=540746 RepID=UPI0003747140|nr:group II truncated hemoglobin [Rudaea cellulosilytica]